MPPSSGTSRSSTSPRTAPRRRQARRRRHDLRPRPHDVSAQLPDAAAARDLGGRAGARLFPVEPARQFRMGRRLPNASASTGSISKPRTRTPKLSASFYREVVNRRPGGRPACRSACDGFPIFPSCTEESVRLSRDEDALDHAGFEILSRRSAAGYWFRAASCGYLSPARGRVCDAFRMLLMLGLESFHHRRVGRPICWSPHVLVIFIWPTWPSRWNIHSDQQRSLTLSGPDCSGPYYAFLAAIIR